MTMELLNRSVPSRGQLSSMQSVNVRIAVSLYAVGMNVGPAIGVTADELTPFAREKLAFQRMRHQLAKYRGQFVAIHNGEVAAVDPNRNAVVRKLFAKHGKGASVYIGFIGARPTAHVPTLFARRSAQS
jgi:hypothetical protein